MLVGYARVSTEDQRLDLQLDALKGAGCEKCFTDHVSGASKLKAGLDEALAYLRAGDTLVVWKLDRLGRTVKGLGGFKSKCNIYCCCSVLSAQCTDSGCRLKRCRCWA